MLFSCTSDDLENNSTNPVINQLKNDLKLDQFTNKNIAENLVVNWETFSRIEKDGFEIYQIGITETNEVKITSKIFQENLKYELIAIKKDSIFYSYLIEAFSSVHNNLFTGTIQELDNYTGTLNVFNLDGKPLGQLLVHNGLAKNHANSAELEPLKLAINLFSKSSKNGLTNKVPSCDNSNVVTPVSTDFYEDRYEIWSNAFTNEVFLIKYLGKKYIKTEISYMSVSYPCESEYTNDEIHVPFITKNYRIFNCELSDVLEEKIDYSQLEPCLKEVMDELKNSTNADIADVLEKLGAGNIYTVNISSDSLITRPASSTPATYGTNTYSIKISSNYTTATSLFRASNLLHEIIHCYFFSLVDNYTATNNPDIFNDFPTLFQKFVDKSYPGSKDFAHHDEMAKTYVDAIALALQEYNKTTDPNGIVPFQVYTDLAWGGLQEAPIFKEKYPIGSTDYNRIVGRYNCESVNFSINGQTPVGLPCK
jgi:hypothetical protein